MTENTLALPVRKHIQSRAGYSRRLRTNYVMLGLTGLLTLVALVPIFWIIIYVTAKGGQYINLDFITRLPTPVGVSGGGVLNAIEGKS